MDFFRSCLTRFPLHPFSLRFSVGLWAGSLLALYLAFLFQLDTPQWAGVSVWIMFMQRPRLNYSKMLFWMAGTLSGAVVATVLTICLSQMPEILLLALSLWLALCAALATQLREYRAYGAVLAGYTAAIVAFTAVPHPENIFSIAVARVSCVALGITCAVLAMTVFLPLHRHWIQTVRHLHGHFHGILQQAADALEVPGGSISWGHMVERLSSVEHTFDVTLAESADSRARSGQTRSLTATLFCIAARSQAIEFHVSHAEGIHSREVRDFQKEVQSLLRRSASLVQSRPGLSVRNETRARRSEIPRLRDLATAEAAPNLSDRFLLDQLEGLLRDLDGVLQDRAALSGPWPAPRAACLARHRDGLMAALYAFRIFLAMGLGTAFWFATQWPNGSSFLLFLAVVCSLLSLLDHAQNLGMAYVKSVVVCFIASFIELFCLLQKGEGFFFFSVALGLFLIPAAYAYTHPRLAGSAVISVLLFYGLVSPANPMTYDISVFLNNGVAFLSAALFGFFVFHFVGSPSPTTRQDMLFRGLRRDLRRAGQWQSVNPEQLWTSLTFDRLRLFRHFGTQQDRGAVARQESRLLIGMLWGLRQIGLRRFLDHSADAAAGRAIKDLLNRSADFFLRPAAIRESIDQTSATLRSHLSRLDSPARAAVFQVLADIQEMSFLLSSAEVRI